MPRDEWDSSVGSQRATSEDPPLLEDDVKRSEGPRVTAWQPVPPPSVPRLPPLEPAEERGWRRVFDVAAVWVVIGSVGAIFVSLPLTALWLVAVLVDAHQSDAVTRVGLVASAVSFVAGFLSIRGAGRWGSEMADFGRVRGLISWRARPKVERQWVRLAVRFGVLSTVVGAIGTVVAAGRI
jgi:hypothetical protein